METSTRTTTTPLERGYATSANIYSPEKGVPAISNTELKRGYATSANIYSPEKGVPSTTNQSAGKRRRKRSKKGGKWSMKYKRSINCRRPKGFSQKQHCKYGRRSRRR